MWKLTIKFNFVWSLFLLLNYLDKPIPIRAINTNLDLDSNSDETWDWMQTGLLGMVEGGKWLPSSQCPGGSFVTGYQIKYGQGNTAGEVTGLRLNCSKLDQNYKFENVGSLNANGASISDQNSVSVSSNRQAVGFSMARWLDSEGFEFVGGRRLKFLGEGESGKYKSRFKFQRDSNATFSVHLRCPEDWAICGMQAREKAASDSDFDVDVGGEPILTQVRFKCCYYCIPQEQRVILDDYTNPGSTEYSRTIRKTVGTQFDLRRSISGSNSIGSDTTKEFQMGNSKSLSTSQSENEASTNSTNEGKSDSIGWNTGEELRISASSLKNTDSRISGSTSKSESDSRTIGKSRAKIDSDHWSTTKGDSSSRTWDGSLDIGAKTEFGAFGNKAEASVNFRVGYSNVAGQHTDNTQGGSGQNEARTNEDDTKSKTRTSSKDVSSGTSNTDSRGSDTSRTGGKSGGSSLSKDQSRQKSIQRAKERSMQKGAQLMFTQRQADQQSWQFNWDQSGSAMWRKEQEDTYSFTCEAMHRCKIEQVYGTCGALQIGTPKIEKKIEGLTYGKPGRNPEPELQSVANNTEKIQWDINIPGETWVVAKGISHWEPSGRWENVQVCPPDTIVTGDMLKYLPRAGLTGIALTCSGKYGPDEGDREHTDVSVLRIESVDGSGRNRTKGRWGILTRGSRSIFAQGYSYAQMEMNGHRSIGNQEIIYHDNDPMKIPPQKAVNSSRVITKCPDDHAICGLTAMKDSDGIGILTAIGFRCCHHCIPTEMWETVLEFDNNSPSDEIKEVRTTVGIQRTQANVQSNSVNIGNTIDSAGISHSGLQAGFAARFGKSNSTGFDWSSTSTSVWNDETTKIDTYKCEAFHSCAYRKLVGQCGTVRVQVGKFDKVSTPLEGYGPVASEPLDPETSGSPEPNSRQPRFYTNQYNLEDELTPVQVLHNGEIWIEANSIQIGHSEEEPPWGRSESCPMGTFVTGHRLRRLGGEDEATEDILIDLELECSKWDAHGNFTHVTFIQSGQSSSSSRPGRSSSDGDQNLVQNYSPALGFQFFRLEWFDEDEQENKTYTTGHSLIFDRWATHKPPEIDPDFEYKVQMVSQKFVCPTDYVICGIRTKKDGATGILTDVKFQCCFHCEPSETEEEVDVDQNVADVVKTHTITVGAVVEVKTPLVEGSTPDSFTLHKGFSDYNYIKEMFSHRLPKTSKRLGQGKVKVDWKKQPMSLWTKEKEIPKVNQCKAGHTCVVFQVVGFCGKLRVPTQYTVINVDDDE